MESLRKGSLKFLIVKLSAIGDVIHALPVAAYLKKAVPGCTISWLVEKASADLVSNNKAVDEVIIFPGKKWLREAGKPGTWLKNWEESQKFFKAMRDAKYDAVLELQGLLKSSLLARSTGAKVVAGFDDTREFADRFLTHKLNVGDYFGHDVPVIELNLRVAKYALSVLGVPAPDLEVEFALPTLASSVDIKVGALLGLAGGAAPGVASSDHIDVVMIPGTTWVTKIWPEDKWVSLAVRLSGTYKCRLILVGGPAEVSSNQSISQAIESKLPQQKVLNLTGQTSLLDLVALFRQVDLVVGADTGPLHLAAATSVPKVVGVFGSTPALRNGPYGQQCATVHLNLECQPCYSKTCKYGTVACLTELEASTVLETVISKLGSRS